MKTWGLALAGVLTVIALLALRARVASPPAVAPPAASEAHPAEPAAPLESAAEPYLRTLQARRASEGAAESNPPSHAGSVRGEILVRGNVRDVEGAPVPSVRMKWTDERATEAITEVKDGAYAIPGLHAGRYVVELSNAGWQTEQFDVELTGAIPIEQRDFTAHPNPSIRIRLVSTDGASLFGFDADQQPLPGNMLKVCVTRRAPPDMFDPDAQQATSASGRFVNRWGLQGSLRDSDRDCLGLIELFERPPLFLALVSGAAVVARREIRDVPDEVTFTIGPGDLSSKLAGFRVRMLQADGRSPADQGEVTFIDAPRRAKADADGLVEIRDQPPGRYTITLGATGCGGRMLEVTLEPGVVLDLGDVPLTLTPKVALSFEFAGDARPAVRFTFRRERAGDPLGTLSLYDNLEFMTGDKNPYELSSFDPGVYLLRVTGFGSPTDHANLRLGARPVRVVIRDVPKNEVAIKIVPQTEICLRVAGDAAKASRWLISTHDGLPCQRVRIDGRASKRIELVPGEYTIARIDSERSALGTAQEFRVGSESVTVELQP